MPSLSADQKIHLYREMVRIRRFQVAALGEYQKEGHMGGFLLLDIGQESIPVAVRSLMTADDHLICGIRSIGYALASGITMNAAMAELCGKLDGCSQGKGGMFGFFAPDKNFHGGYVTAGAQTPIATGLAFALNHRNTPGAVICSLGDGATNQGCVHESFNLASLFNLPVVFLIENNQYCMWTSVRGHSAFRDCLAQRAEAYNMDWDLIKDGSDLPAVRTGLHTALERARHKRRPSVIEIATYRYYGWSVADANSRKHRTDAEIQHHKTHRDPIKNWLAVLQSENLLSDEQAKQIQQEAKTEANTSVKFAESSPKPTIPDITRHVYSQTDHPGRLFFND